jgi:hypothetical protein
MVLFDAGFDEFVAHLLWFRKEEDHACKNRHRRPYVIQRIDLWRCRQLFAGLPKSTNTVSNQGRCLKPNVEVRQECLQAFSFLEEKDW